jgi:hypothetical protein
MSRNKIQLVIGILLAVIPFLGLPPGWKTIFYTLSGALLVLYAVTAHMERRSRELRGQELEKNMTDRI